MLIYSFIPSICYILVLLVLIVRKDSEYKRMRWNNRNRTSKEQNTSRERTRWGGNPAAETGSFGPSLIILNPLKHPNPTLYHFSCSCFGHLHSHRITFANPDLFIAAIFPEPVIRLLGLICRADFFQEVFIINCMN